MIIVYQFSRRRVERWLQGLAERARISVTEVCWKIDAAVESARLHDDCLGLQNLRLQQLGLGKHQQEFAKCPCCRAFVNLAWLCSASSAELKEIAGKRANLLLLGLRVVENLLLGAAEEKKPTRDETKKRRGENKADFWGAELFAESPREERPAPYANVGTYDPDGEDDDRAAEENIPCFAFAEYLRFGRLAPERRYWAKECAECRTVARHVERLRVAVGTLVSRAALYRIAYQRGKVKRKH